MKKGLLQYRTKQGKDTLLSRGLIAAAISAGFLILFGIFQFTVPKIHQKILSLEGRRIKPLHFQSLEVLSDDPIAHALIIIVNLAEFFLRIGLLYFFFFLY